MPKVLTSGLHSHQVSRRILMSPQTHQGFVLDFLLSGQSDICKLFSGDFNFHFPGSSEVEYLLKVSKVEKSLSL